MKFAGNLSLFSAWGELQRRCRDRFPKLYVPGALQGTSPLLQPVRLTSAEEDKRILLAVNAFAYSDSRYAGFDAFRAELDFLLGDWVELCGLEGFTRLGLRFVNRLPASFPGEQPPGRIHPCLKLELHGWQALSSQLGGHPVVGFELERSRVKLRVGVQPPSEWFRDPLGESGLALSAGVLFDLDAAVDGPIGLDEVAGLLEQAHQLVEEVFFGVITDDYHRYLEGRSQP